jgi:hypothetical protein
VSFGAGQRRQAGAEFTSQPLTGAVFSRDAAEDGNLAGLREGGAVASMGESRIANSQRLRDQDGERIFRGAPKFWKVTNRAKLGNVKVWMGAFNGESYPEGVDANDKSTWLQPGQHMMVPLEAGLHFVGNVFDRAAPDALRIIEATGGMQLETESATPGRNAPVRPIGGPIGLPDFIVEPIDGRFRRVGEPIAVYEMYFAKVRHTIVRRKGHDEDVLAAEKELLEQRISEYTNDDAPIYGPNGQVLSHGTAPTEQDGLTETEPEEPEAEPAGTATRRKR